jgi:hypothetical protein
LPRKKRETLLALFLKIPQTELARLFSDSFLTRSSSPNLLQNPAIRFLALESLPGSASFLESNLPREKSALSIFETKKRRKTCPYLSG